MGVFSFIYKFIYPCLFLFQISIKYPKYGKLISFVWQNRVNSSILSNSFFEFDFWDLKMFKIWKGKLTWKVCKVYKFTTSIVYTILFRSFIQSKKWLSRRKGQRKWCWKKSIKKDAFFRKEIADDDSVLVFTETTSNLHHPDFFPGIDKIIAPLEDVDFKVLQPDILLTFGGLVVSKKIKAFLRHRDSCICGWS